MDRREDDVFSPFNDKVNALRLHVEQKGEEIKDPEQIRSFQLREDYKTFVQKILGRIQGLVGSIGIIEQKMNEYITLLYHEIKHSESLSEELDRKSRRRILKVLDNDERIKKLKERIRQLEEEKDKLSTENEALKGEKEALERKNKELGEENGTLKRDNEEFREENEALEAENEDLWTKNEALEAEIIKFKGEKEALERKNKELDEETKGLKKENEKLKMHVQSANEESTKKEGEFITKIQELQSQLKRISSNHNEDICQWNQEKLRLLEENKKVKEQKGVLEAQIQELKSNHKEKVTEEKKELASKQQELGNESRELGSLIASLRDKEIEIQREREQMAIQEAKFLKTKEQLAERNKILEVTNKSQKNELELTRQDLETAKKVIEDIRTENQKEKTEKLAIIQELVNCKSMMQQHLDAQQEPYPTLISLGQDILRLVQLRKEELDHYQIQLRSNSSDLNDALERIIPLLERAFGKIKHHNSHFGNRRGR